MRTLAIGIRNRRSATVMLAALLVCAGARAAVYTPKAGSAERKGIMDALRVPVGRKLHCQMIFKVNRLKVENGWAFVAAEPLQTNGKPIDYHGTPYQEAIDGGAFGGEVDALLRHRTGRWFVIKYVIGATDVAWYDWDHRYGAPKGIFKVDQ